MLPTADDLDGIVKEKVRKKKPEELMPAVSKKQQALFAIAEHEPDKLRPENRRLAQMPHEKLHEFAATPRKGLPMRKLGK